CWKLSQALPAAWPKGTRAGDLPQLVDPFGATNRFAFTSEPPGTVTVWVTVVVTGWVTVCVVVTVCAGSVVVTGCVTVSTVVVVTGWVTVVPGSVVVSVVVSVRVSSCVSTVVAVWVGTV